MWILKFLEIEIGRVPQELLGKNFFGITGYQVKLLSSIKFYFLRLGSF